MEPSGVNNGDDVNINAWGIPVLRYTEEDRVKQKFVETIHRVEWRERETGAFRNPDDVDELRWSESDDEEDVEILRSDREVEKEELAVAMLAEKGASRLDEPATSLTLTTTDAADDDVDADGEPAVGGYMNILFGNRGSKANATSEERVAYMETRLKNLRGVPSHLHRFVKPVVFSLPLGSRVKKISGGDDHALILLESNPEALEHIAPTYTDHDGRILVMGSDESSQLGLRTTTSQDVPVALDVIDGAKAVDVAAGGRYSVAVTSGQECLTWGEDVGGCTGHGESGLNRIHNTPKWMYWMTNATTKVVSCAAGSAHTVITTGSGQVYTFGVGDCGQLGHGDGVNYAKPKLVESVTLMNVSSVACGSNHTLVVTDSGYVYGFGSNSCGQLGCGDFSNIFIPRRMGHDEFVGGVPERVDVEEIHLDSVQLEQRFINEMTALKDVSESCVALQKVRHKVVQVVGGEEHTVMLTEKGRVYVCGRGSDGQLGLSDTVDRSLVTLVSTMVNVFIVQIGAGDNHTVMLTTLGDVFVCGSNDFGQLGDGSIATATTPKKLQPALSVTDRLALKKSEIEEIERHPMYEVKAEQVYASKSSTFVVARGSENLYVCGSGAFGHPVNKHRTNVDELMKESLSKWNENQVVMMGSTFANLKVDEHIFQNLVKQMVMYGVYHENVLAHIFCSGFEEMLLNPQLCSVYVNMIKSMGKYSIGCSPLSFRRVIMFAIEDLGVRMLAARNEAQRRRLLRNLGPVRFQKLQKKTGQLDLQQKFNTFITNRAGLMEYERFKEHCVVLKRFVRQLFEAGVLVEEDLRDMRVGFPGSMHSISLISSVDAEQKFLFFQGIATLKRESKGPIELDHRSGKAQVKTRVAELLSTATEDAAWGGTLLDSNGTSWQNYRANTSTEKKMRAVSHGIPETGNTNGRCESMLSPSTRNVISLHYNRGCSAAAGSTLG